MLDPSGAIVEQYSTDPAQRAFANLAGNDAVTLVFPPAQAHGYSLIVDGTGVAVGDDVRIAPATAVLHRPSAHADGPPPPDGAGEGTSCGEDCRPL